MSNTKLIFFAFIFIIIYLIKNPNKYNYIMNIIQRFNLIKQINKNTLITNKTSASNRSVGVESPTPPTEFNHINKNKNNIEEWRDLPYGNKDIVTYHRQNDQNISRKNLPIYYPISSPLEDNYFNYLNSVSSPKLSLLRNILRSVEVYTNQGLQPIIFNYAERPIDVKKIDFAKINTLAKTVVDLINKFAGSTLRVEIAGTQNEVHEETEEQSKINFDMKIKLFYFDVEKLGKSSNSEYEILYIQPEFIFEKKFNILAEDQFFLHKNKNKKVDFKVFLSKLIIVGSEHLGFLGGRYTSAKNKIKGREYNI